MNYSEISIKMAEILVGIDNAIFTCKTDEEQLMMACCMLQKSSELFESLIGKTGKQLMLLEAAIL